MCGKYSRLGQKSRLKTVLLEVLPVFYNNYKWIITFKICKSVYCIPITQQKKELHLKFQAAARSLQSCPTLCDPIDGSPPGSPVPGILQARTMEWVAISFSNA